MADSFVITLNKQHNLTFAWECLTCNQSLWPRPQDLKVSSSLQEDATAFQAQAGIQSRSVVEFPDCPGKINRYSSLHHNNSGSAGFYFHLLPSRAKMDIFHHELFLSVTSSHTNQPKDVSNLSWNKVKNLFVWSGLLPSTGHRSEVGISPLRSTTKLNSFFSHKLLSVMVMDSLQNFPSSLLVSRQRWKIFGQRNHWRSKH